MTIRNYPVAQSLYIKYCKEHNTQALNEIYIQEDDFSAQAQTFILESLDDKVCFQLEIIIEYITITLQKSHVKDSLLTSAMEAYKKGRKELYASMCEENLKLLRYQRELEDKLNMKNKFVGKSVHETCKLLLELNDKLAEKFRSDYKIPDKR